MPKKRLVPKEDLNSQSLARMLDNMQKASPRQFRDQLTRVNGAVRGVQTNLTGWNRYEP